MRVGGLGNLSVEMVPVSVVVGQVRHGLRGKLLVECYVGIHVRFCQRVAGVDPAGEVAAVAELRIVGADAGI